MLTTGLMGMSGLWNWTFRAGGCVFFRPISDLFLVEDKVVLLLGFGDEGLVLFGGVAREGVEIIREEGMHFVFVVLLVYNDCSFSFDCKGD